MRFDPVGRDEAREMARRELDKQIYQRDKPSWLERAWDRFTDWLGDLFQRAAAPNAQGNGSGWLSVAVIILILAAAIALVAWLMWGRRNPRSRGEALLEDEPSTALDHRDAADAHAAAGRWAEAIRERLRAIARDLEERAVLSPRPGRTADELAAEAGEAVPQLADELRGGVRIFDDVWYGDRPGTSEGYARLKDLDERLREARPKPLEADGLVPVGAAEDAAEGEGGPRW
ncbi:MULTISPECIES: DUF4129 domain-containing protein [Actinomadura]|uniref:DUF4129 domain-containing protein n=1 Tax=Actinomadura litoris TaxID=2678616 RepID=A0A7K1KWN7_9ACTN|nr:MULTISPECIES: DUF4129 domain-containing protein [Actinomadura]MBT2210712.1 DUF4129 domain-containing protein [Actinomadura sp. NEAU-AAG7]MUN36614.1 DUF4129 domain-containing protein [Actinomadura litoris]